MADTHPYRLTCPSCGQHFKVSPKAAGQSLACPKCSATIKVGQVAPKKEQADEQPSRSFAEATASLKSSAQPSQPAANPPASRPVTDQSSVGSTSTKPHSWLSRWARRDPQQFSQLAPAVIIIGPIAVLVVLNVLALIPLGLFQLGSLLGDVFCLSGCVAIAWFLIGLLVTRGIVNSILLSVPTIRCPGCGEQLPLVSRWSCPCGYHDHAERHVYDFTCPKCEGQIGCFDCPRCDATILLR